jgi:flagellum-specific peptidoglycan hydrolase FlgJ
MSKYFETKDGSLEAVSTKIAKEQPTIKKEEPNVKLERKTYFENKPGSLEDLASKVVSEGMDPVNKDAVKKKFADRKDKDIDNDGDVDSSDKFLHKRRKAISKAMKEDLGKEDEPKVKKIIGKLKKASDAHAGQAKDLQKAMTEDDMAKFHKMQKDGKSAEQIAKALDIDVKSTKKLMDSVMPDDKGEFINKQKHAAAKRGEKKPIDPEPKIGQIIKGEKETTRANGHMTKKKFSEMRMKLGQKGKTETGKEAPVIDTEPKAEKI